MEGEPVYFASNSTVDRSNYQQGRDPKNDNHNPDVRSRPFNLLVHIIADRTRRHPNSRPHRDQEKGQRR